MRQAVIKDSSHNVTLEEVQRYMPGNYTAEVVPELYDEGPTIVISGEDVAGWTLDGYVIPRLASGLIWAEELL